METTTAYEIIIQYTKKILGTCKLKNVSFVDYDPQNNFTLTLLVEKLSNFINSVLVVGDKINIRSDLVDYLRLKDWNNKREKYIDITKNAFFIFNNLDMSELDFMNYMIKFKNVYPVVFVLRSDQIFLDSNLDGWAMKRFENEGLNIYINESIKKYDSFVFDREKLNDSFNVKSIKKSELLREKTGPTIELKYDLSKGVKPVTKLHPNEINWDLFENLPSPRTRPDHTSKDWFQDFYTYLKTLLMRIIPAGKEKIISYLLNKSTIKEYWLPAFTSEYENPNTGMNYETYEAVGDSVMKYAFYIYLYERYPYASKNQLNDWKTTYLSTSFQAEIGEKSGLNKWVCVPEVLSTNLKLKEDMIEAFCGAIDIILNRYTNRGYGTIIVMNMYKLLFDTFDFRMDINQAPPKTKAIQLIPKISSTAAAVERHIYIPKPPDTDMDVWKDVLSDFSTNLREKGIMVPVSEKKQEELVDMGVRERVSKNDNGQYITEVYLTKRGYDVLKSLGIKVKKDMLLGKSIAATKDPGSRDAYEAALIKLSQLGVTDDWVETQRSKKHIKHLEHTDEVLLKAKSIHRDIVEIDVIKAGSLKRDNIFQILGETREGKKYVLYTYITDNKIGNKFQETIDKFLDI